MKSSLAALFVAVALVSLGWLASGIAPSAAQGRVAVPLTRWEYQSRRGSPENAAQFNTLGSDGWELVAVTGTNFPDEVVAIFKRELR